LFQVLLILLVLVLRLQTGLGLHDAQLGLELVPVAPVDTALEHEGQVLGLGEVIVRYRVVEVEVVKEALLLEHDVGAEFGLVDIAPIVEVLQIGP